MTRLELRKELDVTRALGLSDSEPLYATGSTNYFPTGFCYYRYAAEGFNGWVVWLNDSEYADTLAGIRKSL